MRFQLEKQVASYTKERYTPTLDTDFSSLLKTISQDINNLNSHVPRPATYVADQILDPSNFLERVAKHDNRQWPKFVKAVCWQILIQGLFQYPFGFGALGSVGDGYEELFHLYELFARPSPDGASISNYSQTLC